tara:strand:- start:2462 stop:2668 length:207 start_codon:yes stop_codon:yes gene_type:complete
MINKKTIINEIKLKYNINNIDLIKINGFWYWTGEYTANWNSTCSYYTSFKNTSLNDWIQDFEKLNSEF